MNDKKMHDSSDRSQIIIPLYRPSRSHWVLLVLNRMDTSVDMYDSLEGWDGTLRQDISNALKFLGGEYSTWKVNFREVCDSDRTIGVLR